MIDYENMCDTQAQSIVVATVLSHPEFILHSDYLKAWAFYHKELGCYYWAVSELYKSGVTQIDAISIQGMLNSNEAVRRKIDSYNIGDVSNFLNLSKYSARHTLEEYKSYCRIVTTWSFKRDCAQMSLEIESLCTSGEISLGDLDRMINDKQAALAKKYIVTSDVEAFGQKIDDLWAEIVSKRNPDGSYGIPSMLPSVSNYLNYEKTELVIIKARLKTGKSSLMMAEMIDKVKAGVPSAYFDTEMSDRIFSERLIASLSGIKVRDVKTGNYDHDGELKIKDAIRWIKDHPFPHIYMPTPSKEEIYELHKSLKYSMGLEFSVYDYIKSDMISTGDNYNNLGNMVSFLKNDVCGSLNIAMLSAAQLNRDNIVADSDKIERYVSASMLWRRKTAEELQRDGKNCGNYALTIDVNRLGEPMGEDEYIDVYCDFDRMYIREAEKHAPIPETPFE